MAAPPPSENQGQECGRHQSQTEQNKKQILKFHGPCGLLE
jgi:hypothetical protein